MRQSSLAAVTSGEAAPQGSYISPVIDTGSNFTGWGNFYISQGTSLGAAYSYIRYKDGGEDWSPWELIENGATPARAGGYIQLKWQAFCSGEGPQPALTSWEVSWQSAGAAIAVVNTCAMSCLSVMKELSLLTGYRIGFDTEGTFFFKKRADKPPCLNLTKADIIDIESITGGSDNIYNRVTLNFGPYTRSIDGFSLGEDRPNLIDKYGLKEFCLSSGTLIPAQNVNVAMAAAPYVYGQVSKIKKRAAVKIKFLPHIELEDTLNIAYGDVLNICMRVDGLEFNFSDWTMRLDLTEV